MVVGYIRSGKLNNNMLNTNGTLNNIVLKRPYERSILCFKSLDSMLALGVLPFPLFCRVITRGGQ